MCLRASASFSKILNDKKYIQYSGKFHSKLSVFQGKVKKISIEYIQSVKAFSVNFLVWENTTRKKLEHNTQEHNTQESVCGLQSTLDVCLADAGLHEIIFNGSKTVMMFKAKSAKAQPSRC